MARVDALTLEERLAAVRRMDRRHLEQRRRWRLGVLRSASRAAELLLNRRRRGHAAAATRREADHAPSASTRHEAGSSAVSVPVSAETAILDYIGCHVVPAPQITIAGHEDEAAGDNDEIDWAALMVESSGEE